MSCFPMVETDPSTPGDTLVARAPKRCQTLAKKLHVDLPPDRAIKHDPSDPKGLRAVKILLSCPDCPLEVIAKGGKEKDENDYKALKDILNKLFERMDTLNDEWSRFVKDVKEDNNVELKTHLQTRVPTFRRMSPDDIERICELNSEQQKLAIRLMILVDVHGELNKVDIVIRGGLKFRLHKPDPTHQLKKMWYIAFPCLVFFFAFGFQSLCLHIATHFYVRYMEKGPESRREGGGELFDLVGYYVGVFLAHTNPTGQGAVIKGSIHIPLALLDCTAIVPLALCVMAHGLSVFLSQQQFNIGLWNKTFLVASITAILKGVFDAVTILPDSIGWDSCKDRLGEGGLRHIRDMHWLTYGWGTVFNAIFSELVGGDGGRRVRYCGDMMISGHTYFAAIFSLSAYKQIWYISDLIPRHGSVNMIVRRATGGVCIICLVTEMCLVAAARFHYTVDMLASVVLVLLLWDSSCVEQIAADWSEGFLWPKSGVEPEPSNDQPDILPSQSSSLFNFRDHAGHSPWWEPAEFSEEETGEPSNETQPLVRSETA